MVYGPRKIKKSQFTGGTVSNSSTLDFVKNGINQKQEWSGFLADIAEVFGASFRVYEFTSELVASDIALGEYALVEETSYGLYKITSNAATGNDIALDSGFTATWENQLGGFVIGPASSTDDAVAIYDGTSGALLKDGPAISSLALASDVATNTAAIATNAAAISTNSTNIATNSTNITNNTDEISRINSKEVADYAEALALTPADYEAGEIIYITDDGIAGPFKVVASAIPDSSTGVQLSNATWNAAGKHLARVEYDSKVNPKIFGATGGGSDETAEFAASAALNVNMEVTDGEYQVTTDKYSVPIETSSAAYFIDSDTSEKYRLPLSGRLAYLNDAFQDIMKRTYTGAGPYITCYGDSNTRYYTGDTATAGPYSKSYGAYIDIYAAEYPCMYQATVDIKGFPGQTAAYGLTNFSTNVNSSSNFVVLGWGTNNVKLEDADMDAYIASVLSLFEECLDIGALPIMLGIPWFVSTYGDDGQLSQDRLKTWNATLYALCNECNVPFVDTYNLTRTFPSVYFNEATNRRHYSPQATKQIAQKIITIINNVMTTGGDRYGQVIKSWGDHSKFTEVTGTITRDTYAVGGMDFEVLKIANGGSITLHGFGRGCVAFYPRAAATVDIVTDFDSYEVSITTSIDNGEFYPVKRQAIDFSQFGEEYDITITATTGDCYIRSISFEDSESATDVYTASFQSVAAADLPSQGVTGREYFVTELLKPVRYIGSIWVDASGILAVGDSTQRTAVAAICYNGFKYYNTTTEQGERYNRDADTWSAL